MAYDNSKGQDQQFNDLVESEFIPKNDASESVRELFKDVLEEDADNRRTIDLRTDLTETQVLGITRLDFLTQVQVFGEPLNSLTWGLKRHKVSLDRKGRAETVDMFKNLASLIKQKNFMGRAIGLNRG